MVADFGEHTYDENKVCTVCRTQYLRKGLEYTMSANGPHWVVSGIGTCTDTVIYIPAAYNGIADPPVDVVCVVSAVERIKNRGAFHPAIIH